MQDAHFKLTPGLPLGKRRGTHCIGEWAGHAAGLEWRGKPRHNRDSIPGPKVCCKCTGFFFVEDTPLCYRIEMQ